MSSFVRSLLIITALVAIAIISVWLALEARQPPPVEKKAEPSLSVQTFSPTHRPQRPALFLIGTVEARDYATMTAPVETDVLKIHVREGDYFRAGKSLLHLDRRELEYSLQEQTAVIEQRQTQLDSIRRNRIADGERLQETQRLLELAKNDFTRDQALVKKDVLSQTQLTESERNMRQRQLEFTALQNQVADYETQEKTTQAQRDADMARLEQTRLLNERAELRAPFAGRVARVHTAVGARPGRSAALLDIFDPAQLRLRVAVPQRYVDALTGGNIRLLLSEQEATLTLALSGIEPQVVSGNSSIDTFFALPSGGWVLGAVRDVTLELPEQEGIAVPLDAIYNDRFIYRVTADSRADAVACERLGLVRSGRQANVLLSCPQLNSDDKIVADQLPNLLNGVKLNLLGTL